MKPRGTWTPGWGLFKGKCKRVYMIPAHRVNRSGMQKTSGYSDKRHRREIGKEESRGTTRMNTKGNADGTVLSL